MLTQDDVMRALATVREPDLQADLVTAGLVREVTVDGQRLSVVVAPTSPASPHNDLIRSQIEAALRALPGHPTVTVELRPDPPAGNPKLPNVRWVLGVGAGKGGVGKSTVAVNLAVALAQAGAKVGLLDADIYGPSVPIMLGLRSAKPRVNAARKIVPAEAHGLKCISMGMLVEADMAVAWRGPMIGRAVTQFIEEVDWGPLDVLVVDLPPGTGDVLLSLGQALPMAGAVVVSTPQDVAFADVLRAMRMFAMLKVELVGLVENMSYFRCPDNGKDYAIFGPGHSEEHARAHGVTFLGQLPLDMAVSPNADQGKPIVVAEPESHQAQTYRQLAGKVVSRLVVMGAKSAQKAEVGKGFFTNP